MFFNFYFLPFSGVLPWFTETYNVRLFGDLRTRALVGQDPLVYLGFIFFNYFGLYLLSLGLLLVVVLVGVVLLLRVALRNTLVVQRVIKSDHLRWQRLAQFRDNVHLKKHD